jgi:hypothetical protein
MGNFTRGKDGRMYYGKGTQGGLAPTPPQFATPTPPGFPPPPGGSVPTNQAENANIAGYSIMELAKQGLTANELYTIENKPAEADLPKISWGSLVMEDAETFGYDKTSRAIGGEHFVAAGYDNLTKNFDLEKPAKDQEEMKKRVRSQAKPIQQLLAAMKYSSDENNYSKEDRDRIDRLMAGYDGPDRVNTRVFETEELNGETRLVYSNDAVRILNVAAATYKAESANPSNRTQEAQAKAAAKQNYMSGNLNLGNISGMVVFDKKPSVQLQRARIEEALAKKALNAEQSKKRTFDILGRGDKKIAELQQRASALSATRKQYEQIPNINS